MEKAYLVFLLYNINFHDSEDGECYAGMGKYDLKLFSTEAKAQGFIEEYKKKIEIVLPELSKPIYFERHNEIEDLLLLKRGLLSDIDLKDVRVNYQVFLVE